jgi:hypothetical protein
MKTSWISQYVGKQWWMQVGSVTSYGYTFDLSEPNTLSKASKKPKSDKKNSN